MEDKGKLLYDSVWSNIRVKVYEYGIEGTYFSSTGLLSYSKIIFRSIYEFDAIYYWELKTPPLELFKSWKITTKVIESLTYEEGLQLETYNKEILLIYFGDHKKEKIMPAIHKVFGKKWEIIFKEDEPLRLYRHPGKIGQIGIHHNWEYRGKFKGWG